MTIIEHLRQYFLTCTVFSGKRLDIDCLTSDAESYSIDSVPTQRVMQRYIDGATVRRQLFTISSRAYYGPDLKQQRENIELFEDLEDWLDEQNALGLLPSLGDKRRGRSPNVLSSAHPIDAGGGDQGSTARYQIQFELIYLQEV